jgi:arylsulfatase A-like enzyme
MRINPNHFGHRFCTSLILAVATVFQLAFYKALAQKKPNVLFIVADDLSRQIAHLNISPFAVPTPNIDALAAKGVSFTNAHACAPVCNPSRTCFLYGMSPLDTNVLRNEDPADNPAI